MRIASSMRLEQLPKTVGLLAGWGYGHATLNGKPLYQDYEMHFMVTQGFTRPKDAARQLSDGRQETAGR